MDAGPSMIFTSSTRSVSTPSTASGFTSFGAGVSFGLHCTKSMAFWTRTSPVCRFTCRFPRCSNSRSRRIALVKESARAPSSSDCVWWRSVWRLWTCFTASSCCRSDCACDFFAFARASSSSPTCSRSLSDMPRQWTDSALAVRSQSATFMSSDFRELFESLRAFVTCFSNAARSFSALWRRDDVSCTADRVAESCMSLTAPSNAAMTVSLVCCSVASSRPTCSCWLRISLLKLPTWSCSWLKRASSLSQRLLCMRVMDSSIMETTCSFASFWASSRLLTCWHWRLHPSTSSSTRSLSLTSPASIFEHSSLLLERHWTVSSTWPRSRVVVLRISDFRLATTLAAARAAMASALALISSLVTASSSARVVSVASRS
mmetsp:Transcript_66197/g.186405  ORF Transcript_66197/g.186405 Transcript_66197/m.186405 type:complete len:375 (-) Transcript_66197:419-1543(-)